MGSLDDLERPDYINGVMKMKNPEEDPAITLTDIYEFLLFNGEVAKEDPALKDIKTDFDSIKEHLIEKLTRVQKSTAIYVVKRIYK